jgi:hypothetical protein
MTEQEAFGVSSEAELARALAYANYFDHFTAKLQRYDFQNLPLGRIEEAP